MGEAEYDVDEDIKKGKATQDQLRIWDQLLELRIRLQKILVETNTLPQTGFEDYKDSKAEDSKTFADTLKNTDDSIRGLLDNLLDLQDSMVKQNPQINKGKSSKAKNSKGGDNEEEIPSDEEITSSEDEADDEKDTENDDTLKEDEGDESEENDDEDSGSGEEDGDEEVPSAFVEKKRKISDYDSEVKKRWDEFATFRNEVIQKWNDKTQVASGNLKRNYAAFQTSTLNQIQHILKDKARLVKRTQMRRSQYNIIGKEQADASGKGIENEYDPEIFDDDDFYHQLLRELIDRKTSSVTDPVQLSRHWLQIQKLRSKLKRNVDTRASKGRKIRYDVHQKLVNYMASYDNSNMSENAVKELMSSLFGNQK